MRDDRHTWDPPEYPGQSTLGRWHNDIPEYHPPAGCRANRTHPNLAKDWMADEPDAGQRFESEFGREAAEHWGFRRRVGPWERMFLDELTKAHAQMRKDIERQLIGGWYDIPIYSTRWERNA